MEMETDDFMGKSAPDVEVQMCDGSRKKLSALWETSTIALVFLRHFG